MKVSDFIVEYLIKQDIKNVFGYPGGMVTHLMDSFAKYGNLINQHITYHEQGAAFAACGYAQTSGKIGVAYATSGPGATNLITGICNAYFDSIPTLFITGQVNTGEAKGSKQIRQSGFQETDIVSLVKSVTKLAEYVESADKIKYYLDKAFHIAQTGRKGPVLLDIPMNVLRAEINPDNLEGFELKDESYNIDDVTISKIKEIVSKSERPVILAGNGIKIGNAVPLARSVLENIQIPAVTTMLAIDVLANQTLSYGFIGAYGERIANFIVAKSDLVISIGSRMDIRQVGVKRDNFAPQAMLIRFDIDEGELSYKVHDDELSVRTDVTTAIKTIEEIFENKKDYGKWISVCNEIRLKLDKVDDREPNLFIKNISRYLNDDTVITTDVGQNQVWVAQSLVVKERQKVLFSGGHGAMGYSLPAAIGACIASGKKVYSFNGDGGFQMNIQELQTVAREQLPIKIILFNNSALGMIRHFQEMYFNNNYVGTVPSGGYTVPNFGLIAKAYGLKYALVKDWHDVDESLFADNIPGLIEIRLTGNTYVCPKLEFGKPNQDQEPLIDRELYNYLMSL